MKKPKLIKKPGELVYVKNKQLLKNSFNSWHPCQVFEVSDHCESPKGSGDWYVWLESMSKGIDPKECTYASDAQIQQYKKEKKNKIFINGYSIPNDLYMTGYFASTHSYSFVHVTKNGEPICGYKPNKNMEFQWNSKGVCLDYVECRKCRKLSIPEINPVKLTLSKPDKDHIELVDKLAFKMHKISGVSKKSLEVAEIIHNRLTNGELAKFENWIESAKKLAFSR